MASTFTTLGLELMATGENAGTWGDKTNTNLSMVQAAVASYVEKSIAGGAATTTLTITDGDATESTSVARSAIIKLTGTISGNQIVTVPDSLEKTFIVVNGTSGSHTVQFKTASGSGVTFAATDKSSKFLFADGTNINEIISQSIPADTVALGDAASSFATSSGAVLIDSQASTATVDGHTGVTIQSTSSGNITLDSVADIVLDADGGDIFLKDAGTTFGEFTNSSTDFIIKSTTSDKDILIKGNDGGSAITALTLDMSAAGAATFNDKITAVGTSVFTNLDISGNVDVDGTTNLDVVDIDGAVNMATTLLVTGNVDFNGDLDVDGTSNLDVVDIDGAVDMASTLAVTGILTAAGSANVARVGPIGQASGAVQTWNVSSAANTFFVPSDNNTVMNPGGTAVAGAIIQVEIAMGSTVYAIAWQNKFKFGGDGSTPTVTATANKTDIFTFRYNGTVWQEIGRVQNLAQTV